MSINTAILIYLTVYLSKTNSNNQLEAIFFYIYKDWKGTTELNNTINDQYIINTDGLIILNVHF